MPDSCLQYAVIGDPVGHSLSPAMQNAAFRALGISASYIAVHVHGPDLAAFAEDARRHLAGFNITVPHKNSILPFLDDVDPAARAAGSVNTVTVLPNGTLKGCSTDGYGIEHAVLEAGGPALKGASICFIGCGGVTPALAFHAAEAGAVSLRILNRTVEKARLLKEKLHVRHPELECVAAPLAEAASLLDGAVLTVQCTSLGLDPADPAPVDPALLWKNTFAFDLVYKRKTRFLSGAEAAGIPCADGSAMLLHQGARSFEIWTGRTAPLDTMRRALAEAGR